jgi:hypothetical protein
LLLEEKQKIYTAWTNRSYPQIKQFIKAYQHGKMKQKMNKGTNAARTAQELLQNRIGQTFASSSLTA